MAVSEVHMGWNGTRNLGFQTEFFLPHLAKRKGTRYFDFKVLATRWRYNICFNRRVLDVMVLESNDVMVMLLMTSLFYYMTSIIIF